MLKTNLATRPFYNERLVHVAVLVLTVTLAVFTVFNVVGVVELSRRNTALTLSASADEAAAADTDRRAADLRRQINREELKRLADAAMEANSLIDRRTFSWTELFNRIETTLPPDVRMISVRPQIENGRVSVSMIVVGRRAEDIEQFIENLEGTGAFEGLLARQEEATDDRMYQATLSGRYVATRDTAPSGRSGSTAALE